MLLREPLQLFVGTLVLAALLATVASRTSTMTDRSRHQALRTAGAHFVAGIEMLQAELRMEKHRELNAMGYPTGRSGELVDDTDCTAIWRDTMQSNSMDVTSRFVADGDGGDRCEFRFTGPSDSSMRILYWPLGVNADTIALAGDMIRLTRGTHVHLEIGVGVP